MTYREVVRKLRAAGFECDRFAAGSHDIWYHAKTHRRTDEGSVRSVAIVWGR